MAISRSPIGWITGSSRPIRNGVLGSSRIQRGSASEFRGLVGGSRFLQTDPVLGGSANSYDYAGQDPINNLDLDGRSYLGDGCADGPTREECVRLKSEGEDILGNGHNPARIKKYNEWYQRNKTQLAKCRKLYGIVAPKPRKHNNRSWLAVGGAALASGLRWYGQRVSASASAYGAQALVLSAGGGGHPDMMLSR